MHLLLHLESIVSDFRFMFNSQNFALFQACLYGFITHTGTGTLTQLYQARRTQTRYGSFPKFLSRGNSDADALAAHLTKYLQARFPHWVYVYDQTHAVKTRGSQWGLHFFRNFSYCRRRGYFCVVEMIVIAGVRCRASVFCWKLLGTVKKRVDA